MVRVSVFMVLLTMFFGQQTLASDGLCPEKVPLQEGVDDLRMQEDKFTQEHALESVEFLQTDFSKRIFGADAVKDFRAWSGHYISYHNSLKFIEGALLKQQILLHRARLKELSVVAPDSSEAPQIKYNLEAATQRFCSFLSAAEYVD